MTTRRVAGSDNALELCVCVCVCLCMVAAPASEPASEPAASEPHKASASLSFPTSSTRGWATLMCLAADDRAAPGDRTDGECTVGTEVEARPPARRRVRLTLRCDGGETAEEVECGGRGDRLVMGTRRSLRGVTGATAPDRRACRAA